MLNAWMRALNAMSMIFEQRQVGAVRAFVVAPADVQPHAVGRQAFDRAVERRDVALGDLVAEFVVGQVAVLVVAARAEIGAVDLQHEARLDDGAVFGLHHLGQRVDVGLLGLDSAG